MRKFRIVPKRDFGYWSDGKSKFYLINGRKIYSGFVVTDGICNIMPGATWFETVAEAMIGLHIFLDVDRDPGQFWMRMRELYRDEAA